MGSAFADLQGSAGYRDKSRKAGRKDGAKTSGGGLSVVDSSGVPADLVPVSLLDVPALLPQWVAIWSDNNAVPDIRKASPLVFRSLCSYIGDIIRDSRILKDNTPRLSAGRGGRGLPCNAYDPQAVMDLWGIFLRFCGDCDKIPFSSTFAAFSGVSLSYVREYGEYLTSIGLDIAKKTHAAEMDAIRQMASRETIGKVAILNNEYWGIGRSDSSGGSVTVDSIPAAGGFKAIDVKPID